MHPIYFFLLLLVLSTGCSDPKPPEVKRRLDCYVRFIQSEGSWRAEATLQEAGQNTGFQSVDFPDGIRFRQEPLRKLPTENLLYRADLIAPFSDKPFFQWRMDGRQQQFQLFMSKTDSFLFTPNPVLRSKPARLSWKGLPLQAGESLVVLWENLSDRRTVPMELTVSGASEPKIDFPAAKISELPPGTWSVYLVRKRLIRENLADGPEASAVLEYYSRTDTIEIH